MKSNQKIHSGETNGRMRRATKKRSHGTALGPVLGGAQILRCGTVVALIALLVLSMLGCGGSPAQTTPVTISISISPLGATVQTGATQQFTATVSGSNSGVNWEVGGVIGGNSTVGTISATGLYTAPAAVPTPASVSVTAVLASNSANTASVNVNIVPPPITVSVTPPAPSIQVGTAQQFTASVTGTANTAVTWQVNGVTGGNASVGTISASGLYTAPASVPSPATVTVSAISQADNTSSGSTIVTVTAPAGIAVSVSPPTPSVVTSATQQFTATVTGTANTAVTWQVNGVAGGNATVGTIDATGLYTAPSSIPSPATVTVTAISAADNTKTGTATVTVTAAANNNALLSGQYAFLFNAFSGSVSFETATPVSIGGTFTADGNGSITVGNEDVSNAATVLPSVPFTGTYSISADNRGTLTFTSPSVLVGTSTFRFTITASGDKGTIIEFDDTTGTGTRGAGVFKKQDPTAFSLAAFNGDFATSLAGDLGGHWAGLAGRFTSSSTGVLSSGLMDASWQGANLESLATTGNLFAIDASGRGTATLNIAGLPIPGTFSMTFYVVSASEAFFLEVDLRSSTIPALSGVLLRQSGGPFTSASLNSGMAVTFSGLDVTDAGNTIGAGQMSADGAGNITGVVDALLGTTVASDVAFTGTYTVTANGRGVITFVGSPAGFAPLVIYMVGPNQAVFLAGTAASPAGDSVTGYLEPQTGGPFSTAALTGNFTGGNLVPAAGDVFRTDAALALDGAGNVAGTIDVSDHNGLAPDLALVGTYSVLDAATGRGSANSATFNTGGTPVPLYQVSPNKFLLLIPGGPGNDRGVIVVLEK